MRTLEKMQILMKKN